MLPNDTEELRGDAGTELPVPRAPSRAFCTQRRQWLRELRTRRAIRRLGRAAQASLLAPCADAAHWVLRLPSARAFGTSLVMSATPAPAHPPGGWLTLLGDVDWDSLN